MIFAIRTNIRKKVMIGVFTLLLAAVGQAEQNPGGLLEALSEEAGDTNMKEAESTNTTDTEPADVSVEIESDDALSESVANKLSGILGSDTVNDEKKTEEKLEGLVTSALLEGAKIDDLRSAVSDAMADIASSEEASEKTDQASKILDKLVGKKPEAEKGDSEVAQKKEKKVEKVMVSHSGGDVSSLPETVVVQEGDSLYKIALRVYGNGDSYVRLYRANKDVLVDPNIVIVGQELRVPR